MYYVAAFQHDTDRNGLVSISLSTKIGFKVKQETRETSIRQAVVKFLEQVEPEQFSVSEFQQVDKKKYAVVYYKV
jgi:hypothetical protein